MSTKRRMIDSMLSIRSRSDSPSTSHRRSRTPHKPEKRLPTKDVQNVARTEILPVQLCMEELQASKAIFPHQASQMMQMINASMMTLQLEQNKSREEAKLHDQNHGMQNDEIRTGIQTNARG